MKKLLTVLFITAILACIMVMGVFATPYYNDFGETEYLDNIGIEISDVLIDVRENSDEARVKLSCTCEAGSHTYPTYYIMYKNTNPAHLFSRDYSKLNDATTCNVEYSSSSIIAIEIPEGITRFYGTGSNSGTFYNHTNLKYVKLPSTFTDFSVNAFKSCRSLEWVDMNDVTSLTSIGNSAFNGCSSLLGLCLPDSVKTIGNAAFIGCYALGPVHLPESLETVDTNGVWPLFHPKDGNSTSTAPFNIYMYFTNQVFDSPTEVTKPSVYYMPKNMKNIWAYGLRGLHNVNDVIVFGESFTKYDQNIGFTSMNITGDTRKAVIFTGDMETFYYYGGDKGLDIYFTNPNDTSEENIGIACKVAGGSGGNNRLYICKTGMSRVITSSTWSADSFAHFADTRKTVSVEATCVDNRIDTAFCYCGAEIYKEKEIEGSKLGHNHDLENGATVIGIIYADYSKNGYKEIKCSRCDVTFDKVASAEELKSVSVSPIFYFDGYSCDMATGTQLAVGFRVNGAALMEFEEITGCTLEFGVVGVVSEKLIKDESVTYTPLEAMTNGVPVVYAQVPSGIFAYNLIIKGFTSEYFDLGISMGTYVVKNSNGTKSEAVYIQEAQKSNLSSYSINQYINDNME